jgi:ABC-type transport system involved in multi-copper enzyme maturation permease subunit
MATTTTIEGVRLAALPAASGRAGLAGAVRSEFTKLRSVRSTYWTLFALLLVSIGLGAAITGGAAANWSHMAAGDKATFDSTQISLFAFFELGQLVIAVIGAMAITAEYSTGMIRTSLTAMPRRGVVYAAKALVFCAVALVVSLVTSFIAFFLGQALLSSTGVSASLSTPLALRAIVGSALFVTLIGMIAFAVGAIIRHTAGAVTTVIAVMFVVPIISNFLPSNWHADIVRWMPDSAGRIISVTMSTPSGDAAHLFPAWGQFMVTVVYAAVLLAVGAMLFRKRDA